jgi:hypothetical protein
MRTTALTAAAIAAFVLIGCGQQQKAADSAARPPAPKSKALHCDGTGACKLSVWVDCSATPCTIGIDSEFAVVANQAKPNIDWEITKANDQTHPTPAEFQFAPNDKGIVFPGDSTQVFSDCKSNGTDARKFSCKDNQTDSGIYVYKYVVTIVDKTGVKAVTPLDPWVVNN